MYNLAVGCVFRNEAHCIKEWVCHYIHHGVEHFYLINDNSTDNYLEIIQPYIDQNIITLFHDQQEYYLGRQRFVYNKHILPNLKNTKWLLMIDMDEFVWSPISNNLNDILNTCNHLGQIQFWDNIFGSNNYIEQPKLLVDSFTMRKKEPHKYLKYFINSNYEFSSLNIHHATFTNNEHEKNNFMLLNQNYFINNHYCCQSKNFWNTVKCTRGDGDHYTVRTFEDFNKVDINEVEDLRLKEQNANINYM